MHASLKTSSDEAREINAETNVNRISAKIYRDQAEHEEFHLNEVVDKEK